MTKALEILNRYHHGIIQCEEKELDEAISELEEAMQPKTCAGCKYASQGRYRVPCDRCARTLHDEYEPKDNA